MGIAVDLSLAGFNATTTSEIPIRNGYGSIQGVLSIFGEVLERNEDTASLATRMRLDRYVEEDSASFVDDPPLTCAQTFDTDRLGYTGPQYLPGLSLSLSVPSGTYEATLRGTILMDGDRPEDSGPVELDLVLIGEIEPASQSLDCANSYCVQRAPGTTTVTGSVTWLADTISAEKTF